MTKQKETNPITTLSLHNRLLLGLSFLEGGSLMATELMSARMLAPYFGSSLFVWAAVLAITLGALTLGYFLGGQISQKERKEKILLLVLIFCGILLMLMPFTAKWILNFAHHFNFTDAVIGSTILIIFPPVIGMGMVSPLVVSTLDNSIETSGKRAGTVYAISTAGGILFTFLFGFFVIPRFGLTIPCIFTGFLLGVVPAILLLKNGWKQPGLFIITFLSVLAYQRWQSGLKSELLSVLYQKEGILGQVLVAEIAVPNTNPIQIERVLFVNRIIQTSMNPANKKFNDYAYFNLTSDILSRFPRGSDMLVLGLGGGVLAQEGISKGFNVDAVELDERIIEVAHKFFGMDTMVNVFQDDARRYLNNCSKKYDFILFDLFRGEETPAHVFTAESIAKTRDLLKPGGLVLINANGYYRGDIGKGTRSLYKTITAMGLYTELYMTGETESSSNMIYFISNSREVFNERVPAYVSLKFIPARTIDTRDAVILTDQRPILDYLNWEATRKWRMAYLAYMKGFYKTNNIPLFN